MTSGGLLAAVARARGAEIDGAVVGPPRRRATPGTIVVGWRR